MTITVNPTATASLFDAVIAHAHTYKGNGRGWDILLAMIEEDDVTADEVIGIIGSTKSEFKAKNNVYKWLQPYVKFAKEEARYEAAIA